MASANINVMRKAAEEAAEGLRRDFGEISNLQISKKPKEGFVTAADIRSEKIIHEILTHARPGFGFLMEESGELEGENKEFRFIVDPLDGTTNFIHSIPYFCISIGLEQTRADGSKEVIAGVIYDPIADEMFHAEKGLGAFLNGRKILASGRDDMKECVVAVGLPRKYRETYERAREVIHKFEGEGTAIRSAGAAALDFAYLAAGRYDALWYGSLKPWDMAAGIIIAREAKGVVFTDAQDLYADEILATNGPLSQKISKLV